MKKSTSDSTPPDSNAKKPRAKKTPTGVFSRSLRLFTMASRVAAHEIGSRVLPADAQKKLETRIEQARVIADSLSHLKGAAMKAGQLLSLDTSDFLPPEAIEILSRLQARATPTRTADIRAVLVRELGAAKMNRLQNFSEHPHASASIGQIHTAELDGRKVAIKVQYPGVADSIDSDLAILRRLADGFITVSGKKFSLEETFKEIREVLTQEVDYDLERRHLERYRDLLSARRDYIVPQSYAEFSTSRVLTMSFEDGLPIMEWSRLPSTQAADREHIARLVLDLFCMEFSEWGLVQTDPNFGNYLVRTGGGPISARDPRGHSLVCLDFGATLNYANEFREGYARLLKTLASNDTETIFHGAVEFGLLDERESTEAREAFKDMIQVTMEPFHPDRQPFRFSDPDYERRTTAANRRFTRALVYSPPPRKILFLHRKLGGIFNLVKRLGAEIDLRPYWQKMSFIADERA